MSARIPLCNDCKLLIRCSDAEDTLYVYDWRQQQEAAMRAEKGRGMSVEQVNNFVNGCKCIVSGLFDQTTDLVPFSDYPAYELYTDVLRNGIFPGEKGKQVRMVVGKDRKVKEVHRI